jgi:3-oxoacyl-[acyl-carrier-protein] synthase II
VLAVRAALQQAGITAADLDHVNAQGYSTIADDAWEAQSLAPVLSERRPAVPVFAAKSYFGSLGAGGGAVELAASLLAMRHGILPATLNYEEPDPACPIRVSASPQPITARHFLKISFTELGQVAAMVCRRWE